MTKGYIMGVPEGPHLGTKMPFLKIFNFFENTSKSLDIVVKNIVQGNSHMLDHVSERYYQYFGSYEATIQETHNV